MLSNPHNGWVTVTLENFSDRASYLTNVPIDCLDALIFGIEHYLPAAIPFDAEGWEYTITSTLYQTYIVRIQEEPELFIIDKSLIDIAKEVIMDLERDTEAWMEWDTLGSGSYLYEDNRVGIPVRLEKLKALVDNYGVRFG